ncbi:MAG: SGNH/GDSL hydrolase family protein [Bacilli bacterium]|nr:SGNH/GDSL hydrolase family protein [Bacilli bacterium]
MSRPIKLLILIILSLSVYFIYQSTKETNIKILTLADGLSLGINSFGIKEYSYVDYYKDYLEKTNKKVNLIKYSKEDLSIHEALKEIKNNNTLKRDLLESHILIINLGYNDLVYKMSLEEDITISELNKIVKEIDKEYKLLIKEIRKYYKKEIIVIGYPKSNKEDYYSNIGIRKLNKVLNTNTFIDTYSLLYNRNKYFSNPNSYYPNRNGYLKIAQELKQN